MLLHLISSCYAQVNSTFANKSWDVRCGEKNERDRVVFDERDVQAIVTMELDIGSLQKVEGYLVEAALCCSVSSSML